MWEAILISGKRLRLLLSFSQGSSSVSNMGLGLPTSLTSFLPVVEDSQRLLGKGQGDFHGRTSFLFKNIYIYINVPGKMGKDLSMSLQLSH